MNNTSNKRKVFALIILLAVLIGAVTLLTAQRGTPDKQVSIDNINDCAADINKDVASGLYTTMYAFVKRANEYNRKETQMKYTSEIRNGTCKTTSEETQTDKTIYITKATLDIPEAKQSWKVTFSWMKAGDEIDTDLGTLEPTCLPSEQLTYGNFNCDKIMSLYMYGTDKYDPILKYVPYNGTSFELTYDPGTKTIFAIVLVPPKEANNAILIENIKAAVPVWLENNKLNPADYTINYRVSARQP